MSRQNGESGSLVAILITYWWLPQRRFWPGPYREQLSDNDRNTLGRMILLLRDHRTRKVCAIESLSTWLYWRLVWCDSIFATSESDFCTWLEIRGYCNRVLRIHEGMTRLWAIAVKSYGVSRSDRWLTEKASNCPIRQCVLPIRPNNLAWLNTERWPRRSLQNHHTVRSSEILLSQELMNFRRSRIGIMNCLRW